MNKIIVPTGYMGSGSSAITDILREFDNINTKNSDFEYIFLHMPGGIFDLEDRLFLNNNALRSDEAIKYFRNNMKDLYELRGYWPGNYKKYVTKKFLIILEKYIDKIRSGNFTGVWYYNEKYKGIKLYKRAIKNRICKLLNKTILLDDFDIEYSFISKEDFYKYTCEFIVDFINEINKEDKCNIVLDQLLLPHNLYRIKNYDRLNFKPIVVSRDPRDVFLMNKYIWKPTGFPVLYPLDAEEFCKYYDNMRKSENMIYDNVLRIKFEDLVFDYTNSLEKIKKYLELDDINHIKKRRFFNPDISIKNIQIYKNEKYKEEVEIIEKYLSEYLYITDKVVKSNENAF